MRAAEAGAATEFRAGGPVQHLDFHLPSKTVSVSTSASRSVTCLPSLSRTIDALAMKGISCACSGTAIIIATGAAASAVSRQRGHHQSLILATEHDAARQEQNCKNCHQSLRRIGHPCERLLLPGHSRNSAGRSEGMFGLYRSDFCRIRDALGLPDRFPLARRAPTLDSHMPGTRNDLHLTCRIADQGINGKNDCSRRNQKRDQIHPHFQAHRFTSDNAWNSTRKKRQEILVLPTRGPKCHP